MSRQMLFATLGSLLAVTAAGTASATVAYDFDTDNQGWTVGNINDSTPDSTRSAATWAGGKLTIGDEEADTGVYAPAAVLGNQSAAYGNTISFDISDVANDDPTQYTALVLWGTNGLAAAVTSLGPSTDSNALSTFSFTLNETTFSKFASGNFTSGAITQSDFQSILGDIAAIAFRTEYNTGGDDSRFDNAIFNGFVDPNAPVNGAVPEPATWALMIGGFAVVGGAMRRRRRLNLAAA
jgi:hypothetical protein